MKNVIIWLFVLTGLPLAAQPVDRERMNRDIEVAENVLGALLQETRVPSRYSDMLVLGGGGSGVEGSYLEGFGVLFTVSVLNTHLLLGRALAIRAGEGRAPGYAPEAPGDRERERGRREAVDTTSMEPLFREAATRFLADYAFTLRQLPDNEKIMIRFGGGQPGLIGRGGEAMVFRLTDDPGARGGYSAAVKKADVTALQKGGISREQFEKRIEFAKQPEEAGEADRDLVLLSGIFSRLYKRDMSEVFAISGSPGFEQIPGLGAVFYLSMRRPGGFTYMFDGARSLRWAPSGSTVIVTTPDEAEEKKKKEEQTRKQEEAYPDFLAGLKRNIVEYGGIVKNLAPGEALIFRVELPACDTCGKLPKKVEVTARQSTLEAYRKGTLTPEAAAAQLKVEEE